MNSGVGTGSAVSVGAGEGTEVSVGSAVGAAVCVGSAGVGDGERWVQANKKAIRRRKRRAVFRGIGRRIP
jgi:hypothetical protein